VFTGYKLGLSGKLGKKNSLPGLPAQLGLANLFGKNTTPSDIYLKLVKARSSRSEDRKGSTNNNAVFTERSIMKTFMSEKGILSNHVITVCTF